MKIQKKIVCLGGGIGTVNLIKGLKEYFDNITVVVSMADEGGSSGRLRRMYHILPPGDMVSCMAASCNKNSSLLAKLLTYRFPGDRYGKDESLGGHKLGNLIMAALCDINGSFDKAILAFQDLFQISGTFLPATTDSVTISASTAEGKKVVGEEKIDLGKYNGKRILEKVFLHPVDAQTPLEVVKSIQQADSIIVGPGDLYTTILPVLIVPSIGKALKQSKAKRIFVVNVANKPFETKGYKVMEYVNAVIKHLGIYPFDTIITNNNFSVKIPKKYHYSYVRCLPFDKAKLLEGDIDLIEKDLIQEDFPLYHNPKKLAKAITEAI